MSDKVKFILGKNRNVQVFDEKTVAPLPLLKPVHVLLRRLKVKRRVFCCSNLLRREKIEK